MNRCRFPLSAFLAETGGGAADAAAECGERCAGTICDRHRRILTRLRSWVCITRDHQGPRLLSITKFQARIRPRAECLDCERHRRKSRECMPAAERPNAEEIRRRLLQAVEAMERRDRERWRIGLILNPTLRGW